MCFLFYIGLASSQMASADEREQSIDVAITSEAVSDTSTLSGTHRTAEIMRVMQLTAIYSHVLFLLFFSIPTSRPMRMNKLKIKPRVRAFIFVGLVNL